MITINKLIAIDAVNSAKTGADERFFIQDPRPIEELPKEDQTKDMSEELKRFAAKKQVEMDKIKEQFKEGDTKKKDLFADLSKQLKDKMK